jgi:hypothetical protein
MVSCKKHEVVTTGSPDSTRHSLHNGFTVSFVLSPVTGFIATVAARKTFPHNLTPASGRQDHTTSPSASAPLVFARCPRPSHPVPNVRDDRETPLWRDGMARYEPVIWVRDQQ